MELLLVPESPAFPVSKTPFVEWDRWDCGPFLSFATRKELLHRVPLHLRHPDPALHIPYTESAHPSPVRDAVGFYIAWLYFGLIAEFLGLNEGPGRSDLGISEEEALGRLVELYDDIVISDASDGGPSLDGFKVYRHLEPQIKALASAPEDHCLDRYSHLLECLDFTSHLLNSNPINFESSIFIAIAALGEILTLTGEVFYEKLSIERQKASLPGPSDTLKPGGYIWALKNHISEAYLESGPVPTTWCSSEIEKVREAYTNVSIVHYLLRLDRGSAAGKDHSLCTRAVCQATKIDLANYKLSHAEDGCQCAEFEVNIDEVQRILRASSSFPILLIERLEDASVRLVVEAYKPGDKYVALSHVWADGLGNPRKNAIQICQLGRLVTLITKLQEYMERECEHQGSYKYRLWIDTLCCPIEHSGKMVSLERIALVYCNATHVLVLDSSISAYSTEVASPTELLVRAFCMSSWMRRLWTLQEGALCRSLCFQFADRAVSDLDLLTQMQAMALSEPRLYEIFKVTVLEVSPYRYDEQEVEADIRTPVPSDEPMCLATLLSLDTGAIAKAPTREDRMSLIWVQIARRIGGIPPRIIFSEDRTLTKPGFRWAPLSLLASSSPESPFDATAKAVRFDWGHMSISHLGVPTPRGLRVRFAGSRIRSRPLAPGLDLHPWRGMVTPQEGILNVKHEATGSWYRLRKGVTLDPPSAQGEWRRQTGCRVCEVLRDADMALLYESSLDGKRRLWNSLLIYIDGKHDNKGKRAQEERGEAGEYPLGALFARWFISFTMARLSSNEAIVAEGCTELARLLAQEEVTKTMEAAPDRDMQGPFWKEAVKAAKRVLPRVGVAFWDCRPDFASAVERSKDPRDKMDKRESIWFTAVLSYCHDLVLLEDLSPEQACIVD